MLNVSWLGLPLSILCALIVTPVFIYKSAVDKSNSEYAYALCLYAVGAILTMVGEPFYNLASCYVMYELRAMAEATAVLTQ